MRAVIQRVNGASVSSEGRLLGEIGRGFMLLLGVCDSDSEADADMLAAKTAKLRVFTDKNDKMNLSLLDIGGELLCVSQFTLCADVRKGNRPSFTKSAPPERAQELYEYFMERLKKEGVKKIEHGEFGADMKVSLVNDGPVTIILDSDIWVKKNEA